MTMEDDQIKYLNILLNIEFVEKYQFRLLIM